MPTYREGSHLRLTDINYNVAWADFGQMKTYASTGGQRSGFRRYIAKLVRPRDVPYIATYIQFCADCGLPQLRDYMYNQYTSRGYICADDAGRYGHCSTCQVYYKRTDANTARHQHRPRSCCASPVREFTIRNGDAVLGNDARVTVSLPAGEITDVGISTISAFLREQARTYYYASFTHGADSSADALALDEYNRRTAVVNDLRDLGSTWQTKQGNYAKRLSRMAYNNYKIKITPAELTRVGNIAADHSKGTDHAIEITRNLNLSAAQFVHAGSCLWTSYSNGRCVIKTNGGFGIRAFDGRTPIGRAWVMPLKHAGQEYRGRRPLMPTFETMDPAAFVVFNGYGTLDNYAGPRVLAQMLGMTYRKVGFAASPLYVNAGGYLVGPEDVIAPYTDGSISLSVTQHSSLHDTEMAEARAALASTTAKRTAKVSFADLLEEPVNA